MAEVSHPKARMQPVCGRKRCYFDRFAGASHGALDRVQINSPVAVKGRSTMHSRYGLEGRLHGVCLPKRAGGGDRFREQAGGESSRTSVSERPSSDATVLRKLNACL